MKNITVDELKNRMDAGEQLILIDVREPYEYAEYNLGGRLLPLGQIMGMQLESLEEFKNKEIIIHCKMGGRSMQACAMLEQAGYTNVVNVTGGTTAWRQKFG